MAEELAHYRVRLAGDQEGGNSEAIVAVPRQAPYTKKIRKHVERLVETLDGRKRIDYPLESVEHDMADFCREAERDDVVRAYNATGQSSHSAKQLAIEPCSPAKPTRPPGRHKSIPSGPVPVPPPPETLG